MRCRAPARACRTSATGPWRARSPRVRSAGRAHSTTSIAELSRRPVARLDPEVLDILRIAIFQLLHLDRVPAAAVVNDAVSMARKAGKSSAGPLRQRVAPPRQSRARALPLPQRPENPDDRAAALDYLAITLSHPRWLAARWLARYGFAAAEAWARFNNAAAPLTLRVNTLRTTGPALADSLAAHGVADRTRPLRAGRAGRDARATRS